jgi:hypothetical protein
MMASNSIRKIGTLGLGMALWLMASIMASHAFAAQVSLAWDPNTESDLAGYRIHTGTTSGSYATHIDVHKVTSYTVTGLTEGKTYYFAATAYDSSGNESGYSNPLSYSVPAANGTPAPNQVPTASAGADQTVNAGSTVALSGSGSDPDTPVLISPLNDAAADAMAELKTGAFRTAAAGSAHAKTRWQVFRDEDDACMLDIRSTTALTRLVVPKLVLDEGTPYFWRAQFVDSSGTASGWSDYGYFSTQTTGRDRNANGIPDTQEVSRRVDLDRDGVRDSRQTTIKSVQMEGTHVQMGVSIKNAATALAIEAVESEDPDQLGASATGQPKSLPFGLIDFKLAVAKPGDRAAVTLYFSKATPSGAKWYMLDTVSGRWTDFSAYANFAGDGRSIVLTLTDGGVGDSDGVANGVIVDPGGVAVPDTGTSQRWWWRR